MILRRLARGNQLVEFVLIVIVALGLAFAIQAFIVKPYKIPSQSMEPTLDVGQRVLVDRIGNDFFAPSIGDIVVFHPPTGATIGNGICGVQQPSNEPCSKSTPKESNVNFIKRVVAGPGDEIKIINGHVWLNGVKQKEPFANFSGCEGASTCTYSKAIKVPAGEYFMMGDNRGESDDSRFWGPVRRAWIIGEAFATYWPPDRIGIL